VSGVSFDDLVAVAALGVSRKGFAAAELDGPAAGYAGVLDPGDPAAALLDAAALLTVAGRAGVPPRAWRGDGHDEPPDGAAEGGHSGAAAAIAGGRSTRPGRGRELSARGGRLLARLGGLAGQRGSAAKGTELLGDLLAAMRDAGYVLPAPMLPDLLDIAVRTAALRPAIASVLGPRGVWLAGHRPDWQEVADAGPASAASPDRPGGAAAAARARRRDDVTGPGDALRPGGAAGPGDALRPGGAARSDNALRPGGAAGSGDGGGPEVWRVGTPAERLACLAGLRERDPAAARELLAAGWTRESKSERVLLIGALGQGLAAEDEEFLENALDDRAAEVSQAARRLLARLPGSAFSRRAAERAAGVLRPRGDVNTRLVVRVPDDADKAAVRDGIEPRSPAQWVDAKAWRLAQLIAAVPLSYWTTRLRLTPAQIVALPVESAAAIDVRAGWRLAAARHVAEPELADWALALLGADLGVVNRPPSVWVPDAALSALLPAGLRAARAAALLTEASSDANHPRAYAARLELASHPVPWSAALADAVLHVLAREILRPRLTVLSQTVVETAGRGMPAAGEKDYAAELTRLANSMPPSWMPEMLAAAETITLRRAFLAELRRPPEPAELRRRR
jgi:hypothetical protein